MFSQHYYVYLQSIQCKILTQVNTIIDIIKPFWLPTQFKTCYTKKRHLVFSKVRYIPVYCDFKLTPFTSCYKLNESSVKVLLTLKGGSSYGSKEQKLH